MGRRIRELRISRNLSQEKLGNLAGIAVSQIGRIERGEINPTLSTLVVIADALGATVQIL
ncbi:MAG: helix-turn-helix transcriptional regulator [Mucilaginibacter sp.]|nr:helix-turn-helix transcriptional regulator [Mucilaginibacter sp.]